MATKRQGRRSSAGRRSGTRSARRSTRANGATRGDGRMETSAVELLKEQHRQVEKVFQQLQRARGDGEHELFRMLADMLAAHATIEERLFYPEVARALGQRELVLEALEEHLAQKRLLTDMMEEDVDEEVFGAKCSLLEEQVKHHVREEESEILPKAQRKLGKERLAEMGAEMERTFQELMQKEPRRQVPGQTDSAPALA